MAKDISVAPRERVNITYKATSGDSSVDIELPNKILVVGDFTQREEEADLQHRQKVSVNKSNFDDVMRKQNLNLSFVVEDKRYDSNSEEIAVNLNFKEMSSFTPDSIVKQVPELAKLLELREALAFLKGPLGNVPAFRRQLDAFLDDEHTKKQLMKELNLES